MNSSMTYENTLKGMKLLMENSEASYDVIVDKLTSAGVSWKISDVCDGLMTGVMDKGVNLETGLMNGDFGMGASFIANTLHDERNWSFCREFLFDDPAVPCVQNWINAAERKLGLSKEIEDKEL